ncbi:MAG: hypothetical protein RL481_379, partial [Pseudomonadota bacterium]
MSGRLDGRAAIVTGAGRGIGRAIVERLTTEGAHVAALDLNLEDVQQSGGALALHCDVTDAASVAAAVAQAREVFGRLDIAVANAGIGQAAGDGSEHFYGAMAE